MFNNKQKTDDLCEVGCAAKGFAVGAENADEVIFGLLKWAGKGADRASENSDKKCSILQHFVCEPLKIGIIEVQQIGLILQRFDCVQ